MNGSIIKTAINSLLLLLLFIISIRAETPAPESAKPSVEPEAISTLNRMADFLSKTKRFSVTADIEYEAVQENGQKLEFGSVRKITILRPDKARVDIEKRDGSRSGFIFDGKGIYVFDLNEKAYAAASKRGDLDQAMDYFKDKLQMPMPLAELFSSDLPKVISEQVIAGRTVGEEKIGGVECDHLAFRAKNADFQIWIAKGKEPLPQRIVIDYIKDAGRPQFRAQFSGWNLSPDAPESLFTFKPSKDMERIPFAPVKRSGLQREEKEGGRKIMTKIFSNVKRFTSLFIILFLVFTAFESYGQRYGGLGPGYYRNYYMKRSSGPAKGGSVKSYSEIKQEEQSGQTAAEEPQSQKKSNAEDIEWSESVDPEDEDFIWEEPPTATGGAVAEGTTLSASAFKALDCDAKTVTANGSTYYRCGSTWYSRVFKGEDVVYIAVAAPSGY